MGYESGATTINQLNATYPLDGDNESQGAAHIRLVKSTIQNTFPGITAAIPTTQIDLTNTAYLVDSGGVNTLRVSSSYSTWSALTPGIGVIVKALATNTGATTLKIGSLAATAVTGPSGNTLQGGEIQANGVYRFTYNGTSFMMSDSDGYTKVSNFQFNPAGNNAAITNLGTGTLTLGTNGHSNITLNADGTVALLNTSYTFSALNLNGTVTNAPISSAANLGGMKLNISTNTYTDTASTIGVTNPHATVVNIQQTPLAATAGSVTYTNASSLYIAGPPIGSPTTNVTITNPYALYVNSGTSYFNSPIVLNSTASFNTGVSLTNQATTVSSAPVIGISNVNATVNSLPTGSLTFYTNSTERMRIDQNGAIGINTTPYSTWQSGINVIELGNGCSLAQSNTNGFQLLQNINIDGSGLYKQGPSTNTPCQLQLTSNGLTFYTYTNGLSSGTALGYATSITTIDNTGYFATKSTAKAWFNANGTTSGSLTATPSTNSLLVSDPSHDKVNGSIVYVKTVTGISGLPAGAYYTVSNATTGQYTIQYGGIVAGAAGSIVIDCYIRTQQNVVSFTRNSTNTGQYFVTLKSGVCADINYIVNLSGGLAGTSSVLFGINTLSTTIQLPTTSTFCFTTTNNAGTVINPTYIQGTIFGN